MHINYIAGMGNLPPPPPKKKKKVLVLQLKMVEWTIREMCGGGEVEISSTGGRVRGAARKGPIPGR